MANVIAKQRGYFGGVLREPGENFPIPDEIMEDKKRRPSWVRLAAFGGKGDHDGDGKTGGSAASAADKAAATGAAAADVDADKDKSAKGKGKGGKGKAKAETIDAPTAEPFADATEPVHVENEIDKALGTIQPDWIAPDPI